MTREQHLEWCKKRALKYLDQGDVRNAIYSMMSDMQKHEETKFDSGSVLSALGRMAVMSGDPSKARRYIVGFN